MLALDRPSKTSYSSFSRDDRMQASSPGACFRGTIECKYRAREWPAHLRQHHSTKRRGKGGPQMPQDGLQEAEVPPKMAQLGARWLHLASTWMKFGSKSALRSFCCFILVGTQLIKKIVKNHMVFTEKISIRDFAICQEMLKKCRF